jgi:hypothetical protein
MDFHIERKRTACLTDEAISFSGEVRMSEIAGLRLDKFDRALLNDVGNDGIATSSDYLLALETIFRRHAGQFGL